jgi:hypothetical protein
MLRTFALVAALSFVVAPVNAAGITGQYIEARTCDVWTGPCFANAEVNLGGKHAVMGWKIEKGSLDNVSLDGLGIVAVIAASDTLGVEQTGQTKSVLIVEKKATEKQREALIRMAKGQGGALLKNVVKVEFADIVLDRCPCKADACAILNAGVAKIETRCLGKHDTICGNESAFYPPLVKNVKATAAVAEENTYKGNGIRDNWKESGRRSAYIGSFEIR